MDVQRIVNGGELVAGATIRVRILKAQPNERSVWDVVVAGATIRVRILKDVYQNGMLVWQAGCRGYDPGEDTES